jgi:hypothetical protein
MHDDLRKSTTPPSEVFNPHKDQCIFNTLKRLAWVLTWQDLPQSKRKEIFDKSHQKAREYQQNALKDHHIQPDDNILFNLLAISDLCQELDIKFDRIILRQDKSSYLQKIGIQRVFSNVPISTSVDFSELAPDSKWGESRLPKSIFLFQSIVDPDQTHVEPYVDAEDWLVIHSQVTEQNNYQLVAIVPVKKG